MIAISWQGASIPIAWECLDKNAGNSSTAEVIALMERVLKVTPVEQIDNLLADREFTVSFCLAQTIAAYMNNHKIIVNKLTGTLI